MPPLLSKPDLRRHLRAYRRSLSPPQQRLAALRLTHQFLRLPAVKKAQSIAVYLANDGEIDPTPLLRRLVSLGKKTYLPRLNYNASAMVFARYKPGDKLVVNCFGLLQPLAKAPTLAIKDLDIVALPLVGFDAFGNRLGMGGGFYDRALKQSIQRPLLIGLAHQEQECERLPADPWDIPLDWIATDQGLIRCSRVRRLMG